MAICDIFAPEPTRTLLTVREVANSFGVCEGTVWNMVDRGDLPPPLRLGPRICRWDCGKLQEWLDSGCPRVKQ